MKAQLGATNARESPKDEFKAYADYQKNWQKYIMRSIGIYLMGKVIRGIESGLSNDPR